MKNYRLRIIFPDTTPLTYRYVVRKEGRVSYFSAGEIPLSLGDLIISNGGHNAAEARFALEDSQDGEQACKLLQAFLDYQWRTAPNRCPKVEVL